MRARGGHSHTPAPAPAPQIPAAGHIDSITRMEIIRITCFLITKHEVSKFARGRAFVLSRRFKVRSSESDQTSIALFCRMESPRRTRGDHVGKGEELYGSCRRRSCDARERR